jgi:DNA-binding transcriptional MerR regulator
LEKAADAFRTISEVADEIDVPQHVLRFWESRFVQIRPMKRGGGRRYYRPDDVDLLRGVRHLLYGDGYTIRGVQRILRDEGPVFVQNVWRLGAVQPPPQSEDDRDDDLAEGAEPNLSVFGFSSSPNRERTGTEENQSERREPAIAPPASMEQSARRSLAADDRHKLQMTLNELVECRRLIENALRQN